MFINPLSPNSEENEISLYIITMCTCSNMQVMKNKGSDHQGWDILIFRQIILEQ